MKKILVGLSVLVAAAGIGLSGGGTAASAYGGGSIDPATCAYYQAAYFNATGQTITCDQLAQMWRNGTYWPR